MPVDGDNDDNDDDEVDNKLPHDHGLKTHHGNNLFKFHGLVCTATCIMLSIARLKPSTYATCLNIKELCTSATQFMST
jgi:hypothetical protein